MLTLPRHCEAQPKQSRQRLWIATSLSLLAMTILMLPIQHANATTCDGPTFEERIDKADAVFEGYQMDFGVQKIKNDNYTIAPHDHIAPNSTLVTDKYPYIFFYKDTYLVEKNWKGVKTGQRIENFNFFPALNEEDTKRVLAYDKEHNSWSNPSSRKSYIFVLDQKQNIPTLTKPYVSIICEDSKFDLTPENIKILEGKFGAQQ